MKTEKYINNPFIVRGFSKDEWFCDREVETENLLSASELLTMCVERWKNTRR